MKFLSIVSLSLCVTGAMSVTAAVDKSLPPLPIESPGRVEVLPATYPESWMFVDDASFSSMYGGKVMLMDLAEKRPTHRIKATADKSLLGNFTQAKKRRELYIMESFHERGARGPRTDVLSIYSKTTMAIIKELVWKDTTRLQALPERYSMTLSSDERFLFVANFSPAASFTVVDLDTKEIVEIIDTPGCVLTYPTGKNSVSSLCSNGGMLTTVVDKDGHKKSQHRLAPFFSTDDTPIYERPAIIDGVAYFPSFLGKIHAVDFRGETAKYIGSWSLLSTEEQSKGWRPGGLALIDVDEQGLFYIVMNPHGAEGTQTHPGSQVWTVDVKQRKVINKYDVPNLAVSIAVGRGSDPMLVVTNGDLALDIINARSGKLIQTVSQFGAVTPLLVHKAY